MKIKKSIVLGIGKQVFFTLDYDELGNKFEVVSNCVFLYYKYITGLIKVRCFPISRTLTNFTCLLNCE